MGSLNSEMENKLEENRSVFSSGWKPNEIEMLKEEIRKADMEGRPLKNVFDNIAKLTGRKPNSIRNFYYIQAKKRKQHPGQGLQLRFVFRRRNRRTDQIHTDVHGQGTVGSFLRVRARRRQERYAPLPEQIPERD